MKKRPTNKYEAMINDLLEWEKKEVRKIKSVGLIFIVIGLIFLILLFTHDGNKLIYLIATFGFISLGTGYGQGKEKAIHKHVRQQIRTIEDEQTRDILRKQ